MPETTLHDASAMMRTHQRNLYNYFLMRGVGCTMPLHTWFGVRKADHLNAIESLQKHGLIEVERITTNYLTWRVSKVLELSS
jgi:hypothetical protein